MDVIVPARTLWGVRRLLVLLLLAGTLTLIEARPAFACSCAGGPPRPSEKVFEGTVTGKAEAWWRLLNAGTDYRIQVDRVFQGDVHRIAWVTAKNANNECAGLRGVNVGDHVALAVDGGPYRYHASLCD